MSEDERLLHRCLELLEGLSTRPGRDYEEPNVCAWCLMIAGHDEETCLLTETLQLLRTRLG